MQVVLTHLDTVAGHRKSYLILARSANRQFWLEQDDIFDHIAVVLISA